MALDSKNNIKSVFIVDTALSAVTTGTITPGSTNSGTPGSIVIANMSNEVLVAGSGAGTGVQNYSKIKIIKDRGANLPLQQVVLNLNDITTYTGVAGQAASEQVDFIGFNGTAGTEIAVLNNNFYTVKLEHVPNQFAYGKRPANYKYGTYLSSPAATQAEIANGLQASLVQNFKPNRTIDWRVITELVCNDAGAAITGAATTFGVTRYGRTVTINGTVTNVAAGDFIRLGGTTTAAVVYKVAAVTSPTSIVLEVPYQGTTGSIGVANVEVITALAASTADFGIKITGLKQKYDVNRWRQYDKVRFNTFIQGFTPSATTTAVTSTPAFDGVAVYEQVANDEYISWGDEGQIFVDQTPPLFREQDAVVGTQYNPVVLGWLNNLPSLIGAGENKGQAILYMSGSATIAGQGATLITVLNSWLTGKFTALPGTLV